MMHSVIKGGWRPTFALAKQNDSDGRKSRIRRSKEERKALVESFIKKYQESNSGNFPSLNLTHKEVGGSFYTVREIVRDIIQENRVLGPAKFNLEEFNTEQFLEQNPLGSIARGPQPFLGASSNEDHPEHNEIPDTNGKPLSVSDRHYTEAEHQVVENGHVINVGHVDVTTKETYEATVVSDGCYTGADYPVVDNGHVVNGSQVDGTNNESVEAAVVSDGQCTRSEFEIVDKVHDVDASQVDVTNKESIEAAVVSDEHCTGAELEIVDKEHDIDGSKVDVANKESNGAAIPEMQVCKPMEPEQNIKQELAATTMPLAKVNALTKDLIVETFPLRSVAGTSNGIEGIGELKDSSSSLEKDEKFEIALGNKELKEVSNTEHDKEKNPGETLAETANHSTHKEHSSHEFKSSTDPQVRASHQKAITFETNNQSHIEDGAKTNIQAKKLSTTFTEGLTPSDEGLHEADKYRVDGLLGGNSHRRSNPTVDRINLESWDGRSKSSAKKEPNPLLALLKAFVNAIGKFLSE